MTNRVDEQIRELVRAIAESSPVAPPLPSVKRPVDHRIGWRRPLIAGLASFAIVGLVIVAILLTRSSPSVVATGDLEVINEVSEYSVSFQCNAGELSESGGFSSMTIEVWADVDGGRFRAQATYPDGLVRNVIALEHPLYPSQVLERGDPRGNQVECDGVFLAQDPTAGPVVVMLNNPPVDLPSRIEYHERARRQAGDHVDSLGRPADLYIEEIEGFMFDVETGAELPTITTTRWYVDPIADQVLEIVSREVGVGIADFLWEVTTTRTLVSLEVVKVDDAVFDREGYSIALDATDPQDGTVEATEVDSSSVGAGGWNWPMEAETAEAIGHGFASDVLDWQEISVSFRPVESGNAGEVTVSSDGRSIRLAVMRGTVGWSLHQVLGSSNQVGTGVRIGVGARPFVTMFSVPNESVTAAIVIGTTEGTRVWSTDLPPETLEAGLNGIAHDELRSLLIVYLDAQGTVVDVVGLLFDS